MRKNVRYECSQCEGKGRVFAGYEAGFDTKNMEVYAKDTFDNCSECEGEGDFSEEGYLCYLQEKYDIDEDLWHEYVDGLQDSPEHKNMLHKSDKCFIEWIEKIKGIN